MEGHVSLERQFLVVPKNQEDAEGNEFISLLGQTKSKTWDDLGNEYRCVILAEAGAGKTEELRQRARVLSEQGKPAFFIRIEDIEADFYQAFEVGEEDQFQLWLQSTEEAWFFLDSVDEARLENPRMFEKALRRFAKGIKKGAHRAHIYLSSRPYAWRPNEDRRLLDEILFLAAQKKEGNAEKQQQNKPQSILTIYSMRHLDLVRIRQFSEAREAKGIEQLLREIERGNLWSLAERPFDLEGILIKWEDDKALGGRLELLRHNINKRLSDAHNSDRAQRQPLNLERAKEGARRLAAAVVLTGQAGLNVPDSSAVKLGIEAEVVLADWEPSDVRALLERGIFNDIIYGAVRFRHRDVRELLAAEWFETLLKSGNNRNTLENYLFREKYGMKIITPRLRPILPWLILFDDDIRLRALEINPEIAVEGGDLSQLPLQERRKILADIVRRIVADKDNRSARDNNAIARIANPDLSIDTQKLIQKYADNDDAIFFLGRLVWQGEMTDCIASLVIIAVNHSRGIYARIASVRAVMTCGSMEQKQCLWQELNKTNQQIPRLLLSELVEEAAPDSHSVEQLLISLKNKLPTYKRHNNDGLGRAIYVFIDKFQVNKSQKIMMKLLEELCRCLKSQPYVERQECHVSQEYTWLLNPAMHAVEKLIEVRSEVAFSETVLSILLMVPALRYWRDNDCSEHKSDLQVLVPGWPKLNDALYWASIKHARVARAKQTKQPLINDWSISWCGHFWKYDSTSLPRLLGYMRSRALPDDRLVALSTAFSVFVQAGRPINVLNNLHDAVADDSVLRCELGSLLNPLASEADLLSEENHAEYLREQDEKESREKQVRDTWIKALRLNPDRVRNPSGFKPDEFTYDQFWLMNELRDSNSISGRSEYASWLRLTLNFGDAVAYAYRDAAINYWRHYKPSLRSEGGEVQDNSYSLAFAMAGLEIEAAENAEFPSNLNKEQVRHALRYITWQFSGFPHWYERMHQVFPVLVEEAVIKELFWELENTEQGKSMNYILINVAHHASWLHHAITPTLLKWGEENPTYFNINRHDCLSILAKGGANPSNLSELARQQIEQSSDTDSISWWYAVRVDCDPVNSIPEVEQWLSRLDSDEATHAAEFFAAALMGGRHVGRGGINVGFCRTAEHLKRLYILMHQYIRTQEDNKRSNGGAYSPELRDDAQDARNWLFNLLSEIPGEESYRCISQLSRDHPDPDYRPWMTKQAYKRAEEDGDLEPWTAEQVSEFNQSLVLTPKTHRQLFDLTVHRLHDMKDWLERGNDSPWQTWQRVTCETELRTLIAGWLNQHCREQYTTAQEAELANRQRVDIWLHNTNVRSPVPIELKLLDKGWSGPKLCERLRDQLSGDYLREESAKCGVMLLVWSGKEANKRWKINGRLVNLNELSAALRTYWQSIADDFLGVDEVEIITIDLGMREQFSST